jgi:hypothetical protein
MAACGAALGLVAVPSWRSLEMEPRPSEPAGRLDIFERQIREGAEARRASLRADAVVLAERVESLERMLGDEIGRRTDGQADLRAGLEERLAAAQGKLDSVFLDQFDSVQSSILALDERLRAVEQDFGCCREAYLQERQGHCARNFGSLQSLQQAFGKEMCQRREREALLTAALAEAERRAEVRLGQGRLTCERRFDQLRQDATACVRELEASRERFRVGAAAELDQVKRELVLAARAREQADDDIVALLNRYTGDMQRALCSASTDSVRAASARSSFSL